jgi:P27 family predicted phage terminase small subunit
MPRGRPPTPQVLVNLKGDPSNRRGKTIDQAAPEGEPLCPEHLDTIARDAWKELVGNLREMKLLSKVDGVTIELFATTYSRYRLALAHVQRFGPVILSADKKLPMTSPYVHIVTNAQDQLRRLLIEFGLSPAARARMRIEQQPAKPSGKWAGFKIA